MASILDCIHGTRQHDDKKMCNKHQSKPNSTFDTTYFNHANRQLYKSSVTHTPDQLYVSDQWLTIADAILL